MEMRVAAEAGAGLAKTYRLSRVLLPLLDNASTHIPPAVGWTFIQHPLLFSIQGRKKPVRVPLGNLSETVPIKAKVTWGIKSGSLDT